MLNYRRLKQDFSPSTLKEGQSCFKNGSVESIRIEDLSTNNIRLVSRIQGAFQNSYECEVEIDRLESTVVDSVCNCPNEFDCQHLAAVLFHLEENLDSLIVSYAKEGKMDGSREKVLQEAIKEAESKVIAKTGRQQQKELLEEYIGASQALGRSPFFLPEETIAEDQAEAAAIFTPEGKELSLQMALRLPYRSKPLNIPHLKQFLDAIRYSEPLYIGSKRYFFTEKSFDPISWSLISQISTRVSLADEKVEEEGRQKIGKVPSEHFGTLLARIHEMAHSGEGTRLTSCSVEGSDTPFFELPRLYWRSLEKPLLFSKRDAVMQLSLEYLEAPAPKILINPSLNLDGELVSIDNVSLYESEKPGLLYENRYYRFDKAIRRKHLADLEMLRSITIPEPLFGTFSENSLPELLRFAEVTGRGALENFVTLPYVEEVTAECEISYLNGELEAELHFLYGEIKVPAAKSKLQIEQIVPFVTKKGILARNLTEEQAIIDDLFQDFFYDPAQGIFTTRAEKKIVEFMTEVVPRNQKRVQFVCPENLLEQFIYDETKFTLKLKESGRIDMYEAELKVDGHLNGVSVNTLWECLSTKKAYLEIAKIKTASQKRGKGRGSSLQKILVLDLEILAPLIQIFDELGIDKLDNHKELRPLWSLASLHPDQFKGLPVAFSMSKKLKELQQQMLGNREIKVRPVPNQIKASLRPYQLEGAAWLERLRQMHLNGILADDMGLGKTLQAIIAITQNRSDDPESSSLIVCPTSLVYNWKEEFAKFNPALKVLVIDGTPVQRQKLIATVPEHDVAITSYSLLQKDIEQHKAIEYAYGILDEAQHIKNRGTRNAKSVKQLQAKYKLILTGTPIENSLDELWSLFDFLMPGLLSSYERFVEKYIRNPAQEKTEAMKKLKVKVSPFILRRMKQDVLKDLPPVSEIVYHCHLTEKQRELYRSYAESARRELSQLVEKEGFDKVQIHVLATLTRLKQICCHPAIFAKEQPEEGDSAKYDMLLELLQTLIEGGHKTVIFSQYTRMLGILSKELKKQGLPFEYLDGSTKNRLDIVKRFNEDKSIPVFLVSLKAGGVGLNLVGADTVIHYDMWWNPAVEKQATDRVNRIGQKQSVSTYKLVTLGTIEEKIVELQNRKRGLVKKIVSTDEEAISKLTWEEVLELLQT